MAPRPDVNHPAAIEAAPSELFQPVKRKRKQAPAYVIEREYAPDHARMRAAVCYLLGLPETEGGGRLYIPRPKPPVLKVVSDHQEEQAA